jgi:hypothetical protein
MSVGSIIAGIAAKVGAELVGRAVGDRFGRSGGQLAETVIDTVAGKLGVPREAIGEAEPEAIERAVRATEREMPMMLELWSKGLDHQFQLLQAETAEGFWQSAWRWGWMYLLALLWIWRMVVGPYVNAWLAARGAVVPELVDYAILLTLTTWFISLYMGGHTVKALGESAISAVKSWKSRPGGLT